MRDDRPLLNLALHLTTAVAAAAAIWVLILHLYAGRSYEAHVPELRYDHSCDAPPVFELRVQLDENPRNPALLVPRVSNFAQIAEDCGHIELHFLERGSSAITYQRLRDLFDGPGLHGHSGGFLWRVDLDGSGQWTEPIALPRFVRQRSIDRWFAWTHFSTERGRPGGGRATVLVTAPASLGITRLATREGAEGNVFGAEATVRLSQGEGFLLELVDANGERYFALLNVMIGVLASIGGGAVVRLGTLLCRMSYSRIRKAGRKCGSSASSRSG